MFVYCFVYDLPGVVGGMFLTTIFCLSSLFLIASARDCFSSIVFIAAGVFSFSALAAFFNSSLEAHKYV